MHLCLQRVTRLPTFAALALLLCLWPPAPTLADAAPGAEFTFASEGPGHSAYFFRFHLRDTGCVNVELEMAPPAFSYDTVVLAHAFGTDAGTLAAFLRGEPGPERPLGPDQWLTWGAFVKHEDRPGSGYLHLNATAEGVTLASVDEVRETPARSGIKMHTTGIRACTTAAKFDGHYWAFVMTSQPLLSSTARVSFHTSPDLWADTPADAPGLLAASSTHVTSARDQSALDGLLSYSGNPFGAPGGPNAAAVGLETTYEHERGFAGGALVTNGRGVYSDAVLSYQGPTGHAGAGTMTSRPVTSLLLHQVQGPAGDWTFRVHEYAEVGASSRLVTWGADLAIPAPPVP